MATYSEEDMLRGLQACNYSAMAALAFTFYDILLTLADESRQIWTGRWTRRKTLYMFLRVFSFTVQVISQILSVKLVTGLTLSTLGCQVLVGFQGVASQILMLCVQLILILRVKALYSEHIFLHRLLYVLYWGEVVMMIIMFPIAFPGVTYGAHCVTIHFPLIVAGFLGPPVLLDMLLFVLTMIKFYRAIRDGWGRETIYSRFMQDGIWAFALPFVTVVLNTCCTALLSGPFSSIIYSWAIAIPGFAGYHLILNMGHLLKDRRHGTTLHTEEAVIDTFLRETYDGPNTEFVNSYELTDSSVARRTSLHLNPPPDP